MGSNCLDVYLMSRAATLPLAPHRCAHRLALHSAVAATRRVAAGKTERVPVITCVRPGQRQPRRALGVAARMGSEGLSAGGTTARTRRRRTELRCWSGCAFCSGRAEHFVEPLTARTTVVRMTGRWRAGMTTVGVTLGVLAGTLVGAPGDTSLGQGSERGGRRGGERGRGRGRGRRRRRQRGQSSAEPLPPENSS